GVVERRTDRPRREPRERPEAGFDRNAPTGNGGVWFRLDIGRKRNADPKWLLPMLCKRGGITKRDIGTIRIFDRESKVEIAPRAAEAFAAAVAGPAPAGDNIAIERTTAPGGVASEGQRPKSRPGYKPRPKEPRRARAEQG
ncbi:MAG: DbpA RNA binding domain-containing protein, partial [Beijerinckiaceae bacterium]|nr:DbpA RNA binding domain-containing protein [Beijerinckiaceae bacterium]